MRTQSMDQAAIDRCQDLIGYEFTDPQLLSLALTHSSTAPTRLQSNERMEFLGDAVLGLVVCEHLYRTQEEMLEGEMTKIKSAVVSRRACAEITYALGLLEELLLGKGVGESADLPQSIAAAVLEAIIGAIYLDGGLEPARDFVLEQVKPHLDEALAVSHQRNYKSILQQHAQRVLSTTPEYLLLDEKGPDHNKAFEIAVSLGGRHYPSAWGTNKKEAEQGAAKSALDEMGILPAEDEGDALPAEDEEL